MSDSNTLDNRLSLPHGEHALRFALVATGGVLLILTAGFVTQATWATALWPWPDGRLSYVFAGSILAAIAFPVIWIGITGELAAMRGGALNLGLVFAASWTYLATLYQAPADQPLNPMVPWIAGMSALANLAIYVACLRVRFHDTRSTPAVVRVSFLIFAAGLLAAAAALLATYPHVFPWPLQPRTSILIGCIFLGNAVYFLYGYFVPRWGNAQGQLLGFLAYDLVLLWPFFRHLENVKPDHLASLVVYLIILVYSAGLAVYWLLLHPDTRLGIAGRGASRPITGP